MSAQVQVEFRGSGTVRVKEFRTRAEAQAEAQLLAPYMTGEEVVVRVEGLPPVTCEPWCHDGDGHRDENHSDDQWCSSPYINLPSSILAYALGEEGDEVIAVAAQRRPRLNGGVPAVLIWSMFHDVELWVTPSEAREFAANLVSVATMIEEATR